MYFQDLNRIINDPHYESNLGRQRINLSQKAYSVLLSDMEAFYVAKPDKADCEHISSKFINQIFQRFWEQAESTISLAVANFQYQQVNILQGMESSARKQAIDLLTKDYKEQLQNRKLERLQRKGKSYLFRINKTSLELLANSLIDEKEIYNDQVGKYFKALLEEYAEHSYAERESFFFSEELEKIQLAINQEKLLQITMRNDRKDRNDCNDRKEPIYMKPVCIQMDKEMNYHYLAGLQATSPNAAKRLWSIICIRISRIQDCKKMMRSGKVEDGDKNNIMELIERYGIEYLSGTSNIRQCYVKLSHEGLHLYKTIQRRRPLYKNMKQEGDYTILEFECTEFQISTYFFQFGNNAQILKPESLAKKFKDEFQKAYQQYQK